jgi:hypothetical protein
LFSVLPSLPITNLLFLISKSKIVPNLIVLIVTWLLRKIKEFESYTHSCPENSLLVRQCV